MNLPGFFLRIGRHCWKVLAAMLVLFALLVSLIRGLLPQLDEVRQELVNYLHEQYQIEVSVGRMAAQWQAFGPALTVEHLILPPQEKLPVTLVIRKVQVKLDFWQSLLTLTPQIEDVIFDGVHLALNMDELGDRALVGEASDVGTDLDWLYGLLLEQLEHFSMTRVNVQLLSQTRTYQPIRLDNLRWRNHDGHHRGEGRLYLDEDAPLQERLSLNIDIRGDGHRPQTLAGQIYLAAQSLDLGSWASRHPSLDAQGQKLPLEGVVNLQAWASLEEGKLASGLVLFQPSWLQWTLDGEPQKFEINGGTLNWQPTQDGWQFASLGLALTSNGRHWPEPRLAARREQGELFAYVSHLEPQTLLPLLPLLGVAPQGLHTLQSLAPGGSIGPLRWYQARGAVPLAKLNLSQLQWQETGEIPGLGPLDAALFWDDGDLSFSLPPQDYRLEYPGQFKAPLRLRGEAIEGKFVPATGALVLPRVKLANQDLDLDASLKLTLAGRAHLALSAAVEVKDAGAAGRYLPAGAMGEELAEYLAGAIKAGRTEDARVLWHGHFADFPYEEHQGIFQAAFKLLDAEYAFQSDWPTVTELSLDALFENARMDLWVDKGRLLQVPADGAHVYIPVMGEQTELRVEAEIATTGPHATRVLKASPLADSVGATLDVVQVQGKVQGNLDLTLPFYEDAEPEVRAQVKFDNTPVYISQPGVQLTGVMGEVSIINETVTGQGIKARLFEQPLRLSFDTARLNQDLGLNASLEGDWNLDALPADLNNPLSDSYSGYLNWQGKLNLVFDPTGYRLQASVNTDLLGTRLVLPGHFAKGAVEPRPLSIELIGDNSQSSLGIKYDEQLEFWGSLKPEDGAHLSSYDLLLGRQFTLGDELARDRGHILLDLPSTELSQWLPLIGAFIDSQPNEAPQVAESESAPVQPDGASVESPPVATAAGVAVMAPIEGSAFLPPLVAIDGKLGKLDVLGQKLTDVTLRLRPEKDSWRLTATAPEFDGTIDFYPDWQAQGLSVEAKRLYFAPELDGVDESQPEAPEAESVQDATEGETIVAATDATTVTDPLAGKLPPVRVSVEDFRFFDRQLGQLQLQARQDDSGYRIHTLAITSPGVTLEGEGIWKHRQDESATELELSLKADKFDHLSERLGVNPGVEEAPLDLTATLSWQGAPYDFALKTLNGKVKFDLGQGHLSQISDQGARIFSLFSLDSLLRKLSLDFSDVFGQGLYFDSFRGDINIDNGVLKTRNTEMDAIAGNMKVRGFTDLTSQSLNYDIRFVPRLASSVPTVVLLSTSAWTFGLGAFALTKVLEPVIEVISEIRFRLTGTMSEPVLEELERKSKEIEIPESILPELLPGTKQPQPRQPEQPQPESKQQEPNRQGDTVMPQRLPAPQTQTPNPPTSQPQPQVQPQPQPPTAEGEPHADQPVTMSEQSRRRRQPEVYRLAA